MTFQAVVRHSHVRVNLKDLDYKLTQKGCEIAIKFGENLPTDRFIRLFHSSASRCQETAEKILAGFENIGGKGEIKGEFSPLFMMFSNIRDRSGFAKFNFLTSRFSNLRMWMQGTCGVN